MRLLAAAESLTRACTALAWRLQGWPDVMRLLATPESFKPSDSLRQMEELSRIMQPHGAGASAPRAAASIAAVNDAAARPTWPSCVMRVSALRRLGAPTSLAPHPHSPCASFSPRWQSSQP